MPDHVHLLIRKHRDKAEDMIEHFQDASRAAVLAKPQPARGINHPVWGGPGWKVFLETRADFERTIKYIEQNPVKIGRAMQAWPFVKPYEGWLPGQAPIVKRAKPRAD
jgi:REP element-mobilizing transposase RayT